MEIDEKTRKEFERLVFEDKIRKQVAESREKGRRIGMEMRENHIKATLPIPIADNKEKSTQPCKCKTKRKSVVESQYWIIVKIVNWVFLFLSVFALRPPVEFHEMTIMLLLPIMILIAIGGAWGLTTKRLSKINFFEWDKSERKRKINFIEISTLITSSSFIMCAIVLFNTYVESIDNTGEGLVVSSGGLLVFRMIAAVVFFINGLFCMNLYDSAFKDDLQISYLAEYPKTEDEWNRTK